MTLWTKEELIEALSGQLLEHKITDNLAIDEVVIDSRKTPKSGLFIALKGENNDAHDFLEQAANNGCRVLLVHNKFALEKTKNCDFLLVKNTFEALYKLAAFLFGNLKILIKRSVVFLPLSSKKYLRLLSGMLLLSNSLQTQRPPTKP